MRIEFMKTDLELWLAKDGIKFLTGIGVKKGQVVLDFGCGVGHYTIPAGKVVSRKGEVYAVDKDRAALTELMQVAKSKGIENITPITTAGEFKIELQNYSVDVVLLYDILHYFCLEERRQLYDEAYRILKSDGFLSVYPKHYLMDEPLWELSGVKLESLIKEIEDVNFCFNGKQLKRLFHDDHYDTGYILNFTPLDRP